MANYFSSFWSGSRGGWASRFAGFGGRGGRGGCGCTKRCRCPAGAPCRCQTTCTCASRAPDPFNRSPPGLPGGFADNWLDAGESAELGRRSVGAARYSRPYSRPYSRAGYGRRYYGGGYRHRPRYGSGQGYSASRSGYGRGSGARFGAPSLQRRQVWNSYLSGRYGWNRFAGRIGNVFGCPGCRPGSRQFSNALSRWQSRLGLRPTGVLTPGLWRWLRRRIARPGLPPGAGYVAPQPLPPPPPPQQQPMGSPAVDAAPPAEPAPEPDAPPPDAAPADAAPPDAPADPPPEDAAAPADAEPAADSEFNAGFRRRRYAPGMHRYQGFGYQTQGQHSQGYQPRGYRRPRPWQPNY